MAERSLENSVHHARRMHGSLINALVQFVKLWSCYGPYGYQTGLASNLFSNACHL